MTRSISSKTAHHSFRCLLPLVAAIAFALSAGTSRAEDPAPARPSTRELVASRSSPSPERGGSDKVRSSADAAAKPAAQASSKERAMRQLANQVNALQKAE
ncbi:MAG TPA: hypothetical protein VMK42_06290 [Anaeromyxobacteraceae bacterium]|nr:hypothetical protein [Anaeromyxobacteraceae bacterium]